MANDGMGGINGNLPVVQGAARDDSVDTTRYEDASESTPVRKTNTVGHTINPSDVGGNR